MCFYQPNPVGCRCTFFQLIQPCAFARFFPSPYPAQNPNPLIVPCGRKDIAQGVGVRICTLCQAWYGGMAPSMTAPTMAPTSNDSDPERDTMYTNPMLEWIERCDHGYESENTSSGPVGMLNGTICGSDPVEGQRLSTGLALPDPSSMETSFQDSSPMPAAEDTEEQAISGDSTEWIGIGGSYSETGDQKQREDQAQGCTPPIADGVGVDFAAVGEWKEGSFEEMVGTEARLEEDNGENNVVGKEEGDKCR